MFMSHNENAGQYHNIKIANIAFKNMTKFKYLKTTVTNQNYIHKKLRTD
jgi:hypothetical protein